MRYRAHRPNGELPCGIEVNAMPKKVTRKAGKNSGVRSSRGSIKSPLPYSGS